MSESNPLQLSSENQKQEASSSHPLQRSAFDAQGGGNSLPPPNSKPVQRQVRVNGGSTRVAEAEYQVGGSKENIGNRFRVRDLIGDPVKRIFNDVAELENYANGNTDNIGDVRTQSGETYWYRLPNDRLTVLGERHHNPDGNVPDVIAAFGTSRFVYEPHHEFTDTTAIPNAQMGNGTRTRTQQIEANLDTGPFVNRAAFDPHLENIVIKAMTGTALFRNRFMAADPPNMSEADRRRYSGRSDADSYSIGDRIALYYSMAIHIAQDLSQFPFQEETFVESPYMKSARKVVEYYLAHQAVLDAFMQAKDASDLVGIYELCEPNQFANLPILEEFSVRFHYYGADYIQQLGNESGNARLEAAGETLAGNLGADLQDMNPAREEVMWNRVVEANNGGYLIAGMGDAHRRNFVARLGQLGIPQEETVASLRRQRAENKAAWTN